MRLRLVGISPSNKSHIYFPWGHMNVAPLLSLPSVVGSTLILLTQPYTQPGATFEMLDLHSRFRVIGLYSPYQACI